MEMEGGVVREGRNSGMGGSMPDVHTTAEKAVTCK